MHPFVTIPQPPSPEQPPFGAQILDIIAGFQWLALALAIIGVIIVGVRMVISIRNGEGAAHLGALGWLFAGVVLIATPVSVVGFIVNGSS
ncbi:MAG: hypothetical protein Q4E05_03415 [Pseudoclavibacter sp.]|nr:hypothetical protein [Pseudoclavibacter sp.]